MGLNQSIFNYLILFSIIPLILSIGIAPALPFVDADYMDKINREDIDIQCREGLVLVFRTISNDYVCTDDGTAGRWIQLGIAELVHPQAEKESGEEAIEETFMEEILEEAPSTAIETIETRSGTITIDHDYLTPESAKLLDDELFFQRAVQVYHLALPAVVPANLSTVMR